VQRSDALPVDVGLAAEFPGRGADLEYLLANHPPGKIGGLYQNDDFREGFTKGLKDGVGGSKMDKCLWSKMR
jgi:hypothetical protein